MLPDRFLRNVRKTDTGVSSSSAVFLSFGDLPPNFENRGERAFLLALEGAKRWGADSEFSRCNFDVAGVSDQPG